jgi:hypothetical protein
MCFKAMLVGSGRFAETLQEVVLLRGDPQCSVGSIPGPGPEDM